MFSNFWHCFFAYRDPTPANWWFLLTEIGFPCCWLIICWVLNRFARWWFVTVEIFVCLFILFFIRGCWLCWRRSGTGSRIGCRLPLRIFWLCCKFIVIFLSVFHLIDQFQQAALALWYRYRARFLLFLGCSADSELLLLFLTVSSSSDLNKFCRFLGVYMKGQTSRPKNKKMTLLGEPVN